MKPYRIISLLLVCSIALISACTKDTKRTSTPEDRAQLFDYIIEKTKARDALSPIKMKMMDYDPIEEMMKYRDEMINADSDMALFSVLMKISNARRDRHLSVSPVEGGLVVDTINQQAPVIFIVDYTTENKYFFFLGDYAKNIEEFTNGILPELGDKLIAVNGDSISIYFEKMRPYFRYSSIKGLWKSFAQDLNARNFNYPSTLGNESILYTLEKRDGEVYTVKLPYLNPDSIEWFDTYKSHGENRYTGFDLLLDRKTFDVYTSSLHKNILLIDWYGFQENLVEDMNFLMDYASENNMLDYNIIWDGTRSRGGSKGAYAIQRLFPKPFKTTFGNLKISDVTPLFIAQKEEDYKNQQMFDDGVSETEDNGTWLMDWLRTDVTEAINNGNEYTNNVPFKLAHLPKDSDGVIQPADKHFRQKAVCLFGPFGGSHLDQFAAIVVDNNLAYTIGMSAGGYSNTWEWEETLVFPVSGKPVARFMWDIGHTIRPNGEILEGNPAIVDKYIPEGRDNYLNYYDLLLEEAINYLNK
jgi:hypothetical protein